MYIPIILACSDKLPVVMIEITGRAFNDQSEVLVVGSPCQGDPTQHGPLWGTMCSRVALGPTPKNEPVKYGSRN